MDLVKKKDENLNKWEAKLKNEKLEALQVPKYYTKASNMDKDYWSAPELLQSKDLFSLKGKRIALVVHEPALD